MDPERATHIRLLCLDVDGVLTDGRIVIDADGRETKIFHVHDGQGIRLWQDAGHQVAIITSRSSDAVTRRAAELGIEHVHQGCSNKCDALHAVLDATGCTTDEVAAVGDDLPDLAMLYEAAMPVAVANAVDEVKAIATHVTTRSGGCGAVRELVEDLLRAQGRWDDLIAARTTPLHKG
jgi:3-deoxy-D-manno-octulosonate 8-phosphate phosphatase (KDO 8-P phosphatase)